MEKGLPTNEMRDGVCLGPDDGAKRPKRLRMSVLKAAYYSNVDRVALRLKKAATEEGNK